MRAVSAKKYRKLANQQQEYVDIQKPLHVQKVFDKERPAVFGKRVYKENEKGDFISTDLFPKEHSTVYCTGIKKLYKQLKKQTYR